MKERKREKVKEKLDKVNDGKKKGCRRKETEGREAKG